MHLDVCGSSPEDARSDKEGLVTIGHVAPPGACLHCLVQNTARYIVWHLKSAMPAVAIKAQPLPDDVCNHCVHAYAVYACML